MLQIRWTDPDIWKNQWLYLGARIGGAIGFYNFDYSYLGSNASAKNSLSLNAAIHASLQIKPLFAIQTEVLYLQDSVDVDYWLSFQNTFKSNSLIIPLMGKMTFRPNNFSIEGFGGVYISIPLGALEYGELDLYSDSGLTNTKQNFNNTFGLLIGGSFGIKAGPGIAFADVRYLYDLNGTKTKIHRAPDSELYRRRKILLSIGYNIGLISKNK